MEKNILKLYIWFLSNLAKSLSPAQILIYNPWGGGNLISKVVLWTLALKNISTCIFGGSKTLTVDDFFMMKISQQPCCFWPGTAMWNCALFCSDFFFLIMQKMCWLKKMCVVYFGFSAQNDPVQLQTTLGSGQRLWTSLRLLYQSLKKYSADKQQAKKKMLLFFGGDKMWDFTFITFSLLSLLWLQSSYLWSSPELSAVVYSRLLITPLFAVLVTNGEISCL